MSCHRPGKELNEHPARRFYDCFLALGCTGGDSQDSYHPIKTNPIPTSGIVPSPSWRLYWEVSPQYAILSDPLTRWPPHAARPLQIVKRKNNLRPDHFYHLHAFFFFLYNKITRKRQIQAAKPAGEGPLLLVPRQRRPD